MQASETKLRQLIEGTKQYVVPLFQRPYSWSEKQWKTLWNDVLEKSQDANDRPHFFGSIVATPAKSVPQGVGKFLLIDGQQRITTVQILLAALRDTANRTGNALLHDRVEGQYLANIYEQADERLKVLPTQDDRPAFRAVLRKESIPPGRIDQCYRFFLNRMERLSEQQLEAIHLAVVDRLSLVSITCDDHDNPHLIFESLNAKGEKLTPADLIRNFLLMRVHVGDQETLFRSYWLPIQQSLGSDLTEFVRHYLMKEGKILREAEVYFELKDRLAGANPAQAEAFLIDLHRHGVFYSRFVQPSQESDGDISERLERVRRLKVTVAYPFLLRVFDAYERAMLDRGQVLETLDLVESFVVRRSICNIASNQLRRIFPPAFDATGGAGSTFIEGLRRQLGGARCPDDQAFAKAMASAPLYSTSEKNARLLLILERMERSHVHKEPADLTKATIEHIFPQTPSSAWQKSLGDDLREASQTWVHTLGNLTLTGYNAELSNQSFEDKRKAFKTSHFELNRYFHDIPDWTLDRIRERGEALAGLAITLWPDVGRVPGAAERESKPTFAPEAVRFREFTRPAKNWRTGFVELMRLFEQAQPGLMADIAKKEMMTAVVSTNPDRFTRSQTEIGGVYINTHASKAQLKGWCLRIAEIAGFSPSEFAFLGPSET